MRATEDQFDYVIVGGGSAGSILARRLADSDRCRVLLLEAGGSDKHWRYSVPGAAHLVSEKRSDLWSDATVPQPGLNGRRISVLRGRVLGGTSSINGMIFLRGHYRVFDRWRDLGAEGWSFQDVLPYFKRLESDGTPGRPLRGATGPLKISAPTKLHGLSKAFLAACAAAGYARTEDFNGYHQEGVGVLDATVWQGRRQSASHVFLGSRRPSNLIVRLHAMAHSLCMSGRRVYAVDYRWRNQRRRAVASRETILCAGALGSPQVLLRSGIGPSRELERIGVPVMLGLDGVGKNLQDHVRIHLKYALHGKLSMARHFALWPSLCVGVQWVLTRRGIAAHSGIQAAGFFQSGESPYPDLQCIVLPVLFTDAWAVDRHHEGYTLSLTLVEPRSRGSICLARPDLDTPPIVDPAYLADPADLRRLRRGLTVLDDIASSEPLRMLTARRIAPRISLADEQAVARYIQENADSSPHFAGSCRMGVDSHSVVAPDGAVHGIDGLRVADASIMPTVTNANTNAPTMMLADRIADMILGIPKLSTDD